MGADKDIVVAFDLYGTLLSTESIAKKLSAYFGEDKGPSLAASWRKYQLEYTWRLTCMGQYEPFSTLTERALHHTLAEGGVKPSAAQITELMQSYDSLSTFPDVQPALGALAHAQGVTAVVFSNGTQSMVSNSVKRSPDLSPHAHVFKDLIVVEEVRKFKPSPAVYDMLAQKMGKKGSMGDMWLVSGNPFDVVGARASGMQAAWVDRAGTGWVDGLVAGDKGRPTIIVKSLGEVIDAVKSHAAHKS